MARRSASLPLMLALALFGAVPQASVRATDKPAEAATGSLVGQLLVAAPQMSDPRFTHTVIDMVSHSGEGAMGLVVNRDIGRGSLRALLSGFGIPHSRGNRSITLHYGGPVEQNRGFVLHSDDYAGPHTRRIGGDLAVSTGRDVLEAVADGKGPRRSLFLIGYAGWGPGQLEGELAREDWLVAPTDDRLIFAEEPAAEVWQRAYSHAGMLL